MNSSIIDDLGGIDKIDASSSIATVSPFGASDLCAFVGADGV
jgi:hypothetical protein